MDAARLENLAADFTSQSPLNHVCIELSGEELTLFDRPLLGYACAGDPLFEAFLAPGVIGPHYRPPQAWLETAQTVVSFFLPFSQAVRAQNRAAQSLPSQAWLYGRVEGQRFVEALSLRLLQALQEAGFEAVAPSLSPDFWTVSEPEAPDGPAFTSNWSERHAAYACGLGTFGLSKGLITRRGMAGRFGSLVTSWQTPPTPREYDGPYDWCIRCGACAHSLPGRGDLAGARQESSPLPHIPDRHSASVSAPLRLRPVPDGRAVRVCPSSLPVKAAENPPDGRSVCFGHSAGFAFLLFGRIAPRSACLHPCPLVVVPFIFATRSRAAPECFRLPPDRGSCA